MRRAAIAPNGWVTPREVAREIGFSASAIVAAIHAGEFVAKKNERNEWLIKKDENLAGWLDEKRMLIARGKR